MKMDDSTPKTTRRMRPGLFRVSVRQFLVALVVLIVTAPFVQELEGGRYIEAVLISILLTSAVMAVGGHKRTLVLAIVLAAPVLVGRWIYHFQPEDNPFKFYLIGFLVFLGYVVFHFLRYILRSPRVNSEVLSAAVSVYLLLGLLWASAYVLVERLAPGSFIVLPNRGQPLHGFEAMYFSLITLTTVGYGDIVPVSGAARMLAVMEATTGTMYVAVLVARLVSIYSSEGEEHSTK